MAINDGGPAYPTPFHPSWPNDTSDGMTLRDAFAIAALQGLLSGQNRDTCRHNLSDVPVEAYKIADAMLRARTQDASHEQG